MPPRRSTSSKQLPTVPTHEIGGTKPIQTTTNSVPKLQMPMADSAIPLTEANLNAAGGNTKASAVTVHDSEGPSAVAAPSKRQGPAQSSSIRSYVSGGKHVQRAHNIDDAEADVLSLTRHPAVQEDEVS